MNGPSEDTTFSSFELVWRDEPAAIAPIGLPIMNTEFYILNATMELVPAGEIGELYIGGDGLARGYLNRPALTAERFVPDPVSGRYGTRLYYTGDRVRRLPDGRFEYVGRVDYQVKIRGYRVELGEIEAELAEQEGVREAVVVARDDGAGEKRLVAYYTCAESAEEVGAEQLRRGLGERLPEYMVPSVYVRLETLPLTPNGKLDRKALPAPEGDAYAVRGYEAPVGEIEEKIAAIWAEVLKVERVGRQDNFFALGGHSLLAVRVIARLRQALNLEVALADIFARPVLSDLADEVLNVRLEQFDPSELVRILKLRY